MLIRLITPDDPVPKLEDRRELNMLYHPLAVLSDLYRSLSVFTSLYWSPPVYSGFKQCLADYPFFYSVYLIAFSGFQRRVKRKKERGRRKEEKDEGEEENEKGE